MMTTWEVWRALHRPPRNHRLFQHTLAQTAAPRKPSASTNVILSGILLLTLVAFLSRELSSLVSLLILILIPLAAMQFILTGLIYGLRWATLSVQAIDRLHRSGSYDLLCTTPTGSLNIHWVVSVAVLHGSIGTFLLNARSLWSARMFLTIPLVIYLTFQAGVIEQPGVNALAMCLYFALITLWFWFEDMQSVALGGLLSMLVPNYLRDSLEIRVGTVASYLGIQVLAYGLALLLFLGLLPAAYHLAGLQGWVVDVSRPALALLVLVSVREACLRLLWIRLTSRLNASPKANLITGYRV